MSSADSPNNGGDQSYDPIKSRVFVGNLYISPNTKEHLEEIFSKYGKVLGVNVLRSFAFIQYDNETSAAEAIKNEAGRIIKNRKLDIKPACRGAKRSSPERVRERSPLADDDERGGGSGGIRSSRGKGRIADMDWREDRYARSDGPYPVNEIVKGSGSYGDLSLPPQSSTLKANVERTNDCEIIVVHKSVTKYAEFIEHRLKKLGLTVDLLFPNEEIPLGRVLANISSRGSLYAIIVSGQNEEHRSLTVNILHGQHQEHRNMPMEDAISLIVRNFDVFIRGDGAGFNPNAMSDRHPEAIQTLLNLLHLNRQLTVLQYDKVIKYLQERREAQVRLEVGDGDSVVPPVTISADPVKSKQEAELQNRIMTILNKSSVTNSGGDSNAHAPHQSAHAQWGGVSGASATLPLGQIKVGAGPPPLLNNPNVQKVLDDLLQNDLLRKIAPGNSSGPPPSQPLFGAYSMSGRKF